MRSLGVISLLFSLCACAFSVADSWLQPEWIEDLKNININEDPRPHSPILLKDEDIHSPNYNGNNIILSVTKETEEDVTDVYSIEDYEQENAEDEKAEQDDIPIIISSEPVQKEVVAILPSSSESSEKPKTNQSEVPLHTIEPISLAEVLKRLDKMTIQIRTQETIINELSKNNKNLKDKFDQIDKKTKVNNVIFMNIRESKNENYKSLLQKVVQILNRIMRLRVGTNNIVMASRFNCKDTDRSRPVVVTFSNFETKLRVLAAKNKLKKSNFHILDDYSDVINHSRTLLLPFLHEKRRQGHRVSMVQDRLIVNGVKKSLGDLRQESRRKVQEKVSKPNGLEDKNVKDKLKVEKKVNGTRDEQ